MCGVGGVVVCYFVGFFAGWWVVVVGFLLIVGWECVVVLGVCHVFVFGWLFGVCGCGVLWVCGFGVLVGFVAVCFALVLGCLSHALIVVWLLFFVFVVWCVLGGLWVVVSAELTRLQVFPPATVQLDALGSLC
uniref:NADH dehydrogenase subunit 6 n=1 Tax=Knipowitschia caucasica TaxID=637954 RepID=A0AAV2JSH6_KNICA